MAGRIQWNSADTTSSNRGGVAVAQRKPGQVGRINWDIHIDPVQQAREQHARDVQKMQEQGKQIDSELEKAQHPGFWLQTKNFFSSFKPSNIKATVKNTSHGGVTETAASIGSGLLDIGPSVGNTLYNVHAAISEAINNPIRKALHQEPLQYGRSPYLLPGKKAMEYSGN